MPVILKPFKAFNLNLEQVMGIEPTWSAWKAETLPLSYTCACVSRISYLYEFVNNFNRYI